MTKNDEPCYELNEIIYHLAGRFWKQTYNNLLLKLSDVEKDADISVKESINKFRRVTAELAKENNLTCKTTNINGRIYLSLVPFPIYVGIDKGNGEISIATPHINTMNFQFDEYKSALKWIENYIKIDIQPLNIQTDTVKEKFYLNTKSAEIIKTSIKSITAAILQKKGLKYEIKQNRLRSEISMELSPEHIFRIDIYHKAFGEDSSLLVNQLNNPHKEFIEDKMDCYFLEDDSKLPEYSSDFIDAEQYRLRLLSQQMAVRQN